MPTLTGTSVRGGQQLSAYVALSLDQFQLVIPSLNALPPRRLGYFYLIHRRNAAPNQLMVVAEGYIRSPGTYRFFNGENILASSQFAVYADWDVAGLGYSFTYS